MNLEGLTEAEILPRIPTSDNATLKEVLRKFWINPNLFRKGELEQGQAPMNARERVWLALHTELRKRGCANIIELSDEVQHM